MDDLLQPIRQRALQLLSRREYSARELQQKLLPDHDAGLVDSVLEQLALQGLQSDTRFAELWARSRLGQGYGPIRIQTELRHKGIASEMILSLLSDDSIDWFAQAQQVCERRFRGNKALDQREKARRYRFLQYRGFTADQIRFALDQDK